MHSYRNLIFLSTILLFFTACAGKKTRTYPPTLNLPKPTTSVEGPETWKAPAPVSESEEPAFSESAKSYSPNVTLVVGGAGVASFATVGLLKRFSEEGIRVDTIVAVGTPSLFALGYGMMRSVHDLEWFATRLSDADLKKLSSFSDSEGKDPENYLSKMVRGALRYNSLTNTKIPVVLSVPNPSSGDVEVFDRGEWVEPFVRTMAVPGFFTPLPSAEGDAMKKSCLAMDVEEAQRRGTKVIVAVSMYQDFLISLRSDKKVKELGEGNVTKFAHILQKNIQEQVGLASVSGRITLGKAPSDFDARRVAMVAGYREGARLAKLIRAKLND